MKLTHIIKICSFEIKEYFFTTLFGGLFEMYSGVKITILSVFQRIIEDYKLMRGRKNEIKCIDEISG